MTNNEEFEKILENIDENGPAPAEEPERQYYFIKKARALVKKMSEELGRPLISSVTTFGWQKLTDLIRRSQVADIIHKELTQTL